MRGREAGPNGQGKQGRGSGGASPERAGLKPGTEPYPDGKVLWLMVRAHLGPFPVSRLPLPAETHVCYFPVKAMSCQGHNGAFSRFFLGLRPHADTAWGPRGAMSSSKEPQGQAACPWGLAAGPYGTAAGCGIGLAGDWPRPCLAKMPLEGNGGMQAGRAPVTGSCQVRRLLRARPCPSRHRQATAPGT